MDVAEVHRLTAVHLVELPVARIGVAGVIVAMIRTEDSADHQFVVAHQSVAGEGHVPRGILLADPYPDELGSDIAEIAGTAELPDETAAAAVAGIEAEAEAAQDEGGTLLPSRGAPAAVATGQQS